MKKTKLLIFSFHTLSFIFEAVLPVLLFGNILPYTHEGKEAGLTKIGYIAAATLTVLLAIKLVKCIDKTRMFRRQVIISAILIVVWMVLGHGLVYIADILNGICLYWGRITLFLLIGQLLKLVAVKMQEVEKDER